MGSAHRGADRITPVHHVQTTVQIGYLDKNQVRRPMDPPELPFKLLRYLLPWWKGSDAWLNRAVAIGQRKTDLYYECPMIAHWEGYYIWAATETGRFDSSANLTVAVTRDNVIPDPSGYGFEDLKPCERNPAILEIGP